LISLAVLDQGDPVLPCPLDYCLMEKVCVSISFANPCLFDSLAMVFSISLHKMVVLMRKCGFFAVVSV